MAKGGVWDESILNNFMDDVFSFSFKENKYVFKVRVTTTDRSGNVHHVVNTRTDDAPPFSGNDMMTVCLKHTEDELLAELTKRIPKKIDASDARTIALVSLRASLPTMTSFARLKALRDTLQMIPKRKPMSLIFKNRHTDGFIKRYDQLAFVPFVYKDPTPQNVFNTFGGFPLLHFKKTRNVDWKKTAVYTWLFEVYAFAEPEMLEKMLNLLSWFIQNPSTRSERLWVIMSRKHGSGKSSLFWFLLALTSPESGIFYNSMEDFLDPFNIAQVNKRIVFIDDIQDATPRQSKRLHPLVTCKTMKYNGKHMKHFVLDCAAEIFVTSNDDLPV